MNKKYLVAVVGSALVAVGNTAQALDVTFSGQISRAAMQADDGVNKELHNVDGGNLTRFRFTGSEELVPGMTAGVQLEWEYLSNASGSVSNAGCSTTCTGKSVAPTLDERLANVYFEGGFGKFSIGQGPGAAKDAVKLDLSGTDVISPGSVQDWGGSMTFTAGSTSPKVTDVINNKDFESRYDRLYYSTPAFGGVKLVASKGVKSSLDVTEFAIWYNGDFGGAGKIAGAFGRSTKDTGTAATGDVVTTGGSVAWLLPFGLNVMLATSKESDDSDATSNDKYSYLKVGYKTGAHAMSVDFARGKDQSLEGDKADMKGIGYVYSVTKWAEIYGGYRVFSLDRSGEDFNDIKIISLGTRLKF